MRNKKYTTEEALKEVFERIRPSLVGKSEYDRVKNYEKRYYEGKLGQRAITNLLEKYGFTLIERIVYWKKEGSETPIQKQGKKS